MGKPEDMEARRLHFGTNDMPTLKSMSFLTLMANALCDFVVLFLLFAALASLILFVVIAIIPDKHEDHYYNYKISKKMAFLKNLPTCFVERAFVPRQRKILLFPALCLKMNYCALKLNDETFICLMF